MGFDIRSALGGGAVAGFFGGGGKDPAKEARKYLDQIPGMGREAYNPYIERGGRAGNIIEGEYGKLLNPTSFIDAIMKNYNLSQGAQYQKDLLGRDIGASAAAGGYAGTPEHQRSYGEMADKIISGDMQQYLQNALGVYNTGLEGERGLYGTGFEASKSLADLLGGALSSQAGLSYQSANQKNMDRNALMNALINALSKGAGAYTGGGF